MPEDTQQKNIYIFLIKTHSYTNTVRPLKRTLLFKFTRLGGTVWIELCFQVVNRLLSLFTKRPSLAYIMFHMTFIVYVNSKAGSLGGKYLSIP